MKLRRTATYVTSLLAAVTLALTGASAAAAADAQAAGGYVALGDSYSSGVGAALRQRQRRLPAHPQGVPRPVGRRELARQLRLRGLLRCGDQRCPQQADGPAELLHQPRLAHHRRQRRRVRGRHDHLRPPVRGQLHRPGQHGQGLRREHPARPARLGLLAGPRQGPLGQRRRPRLPAVLQAQRHLRGRPDRGERTAINGAADLLNSVISKRAADHGYAYGDIAAAFTGHEICSGDSWLHSVKWTGINDSYHPTAAGQSGGYLPVLNSKA